MRALSRARYAHSGSPEGLPQLEPAGGTPVRFQAALRRSDAAPPLPASDKEGQRRLETGACKSLVSIASVPRAAVLTDLARRRRLDALKAQLANIQCIDEGIDHANRIALVNPVIEAFRQQRRLRSICPCNEALHQFPPESPRES